MFNLQKGHKTLERKTCELEDRVKAAELAADVASRHLTWKVILLAKYWDYNLGTDSRAWGLIDAP